MMMAVQQGWHACSHLLMEVSYMWVKSMAYLVDRFIESQACHLILLLTDFKIRTFSHCQENLCGTAA